MFGLPLGLASFPLFGREAADSLPCKGRGIEGSATSPPPACTSLSRGGGRAKGQRPRGGHIVRTLGCGKGAVVLMGTFQAGLALSHWG